MSTWVRVYSPKALGPLDPDVFRKGITQRLATLTYLLCPDEEEEADDVLQRLRIEPRGAENLNIFYRREANRFIPVERWSGERAAEEVQEALDGLEGYPDPGGARVRDVLSRTAETVAFELKYSDVQGMGYPVAIAAAATLADLSGGVINADDYGWMVPDPGGRDVAIILEA